MSAEQQVKEVIAQTLSLTPDEIKMDGTLAQSLDVDSTEMVDLRVALEKALDVKFEPNEVTKNSTPEDIVTAIEGKKASA